MININSTIRRADTARQNDPDSASRLSRSLPSLKTELQIRGYTGFKGENGKEGNSQTEGTVYIDDKIK